MKIMKPIPMGTTLADLYRVDAHLGKGGYGHVYACTQLSTGQEVALKVLTPDTGEDALVLSKEIDRPRNR